MSEFDEESPPKIPKYIQKILVHYRQCWPKTDMRCLHCGNCIAFVLAISEELKLWLPRGGVPSYLGATGETSFIKFLGSTISSEYLPCRYNRALSLKRIDSFSMGLLRLPIETRRWIRSLTYLGHSEFKHGNTFVSSITALVANPKKLRDKVLGIENKP